MVNSDGQLFTIEGISAGLIMLLTAYIVVNTTSIYTPGDTHISDMQLEQLGSDALRLMNTPNTSATSAESSLQKIIINNDTAQFSNTFLWFCNSTTSGTNDNLQFTADLYYRDKNTNSVNKIHLTQTRNLIGGEHPVRVTEWVHLNSNGQVPVNNREQAVLVEVLLWRD
ncbi:MAG: hypothetical protein ABR887_06250 [Methanoregulaceae archaeon]|jgi:hypothetical protein